MDWLKEIIFILERMNPRTKAIENAIHVFKYGKGWLTDDLPSKIFFFTDFYEEGENTMIRAHDQDYKEEAWKQYSMQELGNWVHLLSKRAQHRSNLDKCKKDLYDARNYLSMMEEKLKEIEYFDDNAGK